MARYRDEIPVFLIFDMVVNNQKSGISSIAYRIEKGVCFLGGRGRLCNPKMNINILLTLNVECLCFNCVYICMLGETKLNEFESESEST